MRRFFLWGAVLTIAGLVTPAFSQSERVIEVESRGQKSRALLTVPQEPVGSVILLAGGHGNLSLSATGQIGWGRGNQLVRTRADYARAGFATLVPDIAPDLKQGDGVVPRYRWSAAYAQDIGAMVAHMRKIAQPVYLVGTSRAALSVFAAATRLSGPQAPDALVITAGMLMHLDERQPSVQRNVQGLERVQQPTFIVFHKDDPCRYTPASSAEGFRKLLTGSRKTDVKILTGGSAGSGEPCEARTHHGFAGQDAEVVATVGNWLKALPRP